MYSFHGLAELAHKISSEYYTSRKDTDISKTSQNSTLENSEEISMVIVRMITIPINTIITTTLIIYEASTASLPPTARRKFSCIRLPQDHFMKLLKDFADDQKAGMSYASC